MLLAGQVKLKIIGVSLTVIVLVSLTISLAQSSYREVESWTQAPFIPGNIEWEMARVTTNAAGDIIYGFRRFDPPILEFDTAGNIKKIWGEDMFVWPHGLYVDPDGFLWATDATIGPGSGLATNLPLAPLLPAKDLGRGHQVFKFGSNGEVLLTLGKQGVAGDGRDTFNGPADIVVGKNGDLFVADGHINSRVVKFTKDGKYIKEWGKKGSGPGEFDVPHALALDSQGRLFVADRSNNRIQIFNQEGQFLDQWKQFGSPSGIAIAPDDTMYVTDQGKETISVGSAKDGKVTAVIDGIRAEGITVDGNGNVYAGEVFARSLRKFVKN